jgi:DNA-directed RNA polymerase subunit H (RpoH/RPB5)
MLEVTMRDFLRSPRSYLPPPPEGMRILRRDGANFYIYPDVRHDVRQTGTIPPENKTSTVPPENIVEKSETLMGYCKKHFEKGKKYPIVFVTWEDENGVEVSDLEILMTKYKLKNLSQLPEISRFDPVALLIMLRPGQVCEINRKSATSVSTLYYRVCV